MEGFLLILAVLMIVSIIQYFRSPRRRLWFGIGTLSSVLIFLFSGDVPRPESPGSAPAAATNASATASGTPPDAPDVDDAAAEQAAVMQQQAAAAKEAELAAQQAAQQKSDQEAAAAQAEHDKKYGFHCLSFWDGSHPGIVRAVKDRLNDPDSFEHDETKVYPVNEEGRNAVFMAFRARNGFGGVVRGEALGSFDNSSCEDVQAEILEQP